MSFGIFELPAAEAAEAAERFSQPPPIPRQVSSVLIGHARLSSPALAPRTGSLRRRSARSPSRSTRGALLNQEPMRQAVVKGGR